jgi:hypothetical protein
MTKYLDMRQDSEPPPPDVATQLRANPRVRALLWRLVTAAALTPVGLLISHVP